MTSADDSPSFRDIRACLLSSVDFAEEFAHDRPEYSAAVTRYSQEIRRLKKELRSSLQEDSARSGLPDIMVGLSGARAMASIMVWRSVTQKRVGLSTGFRMV